MKNLIPLLSISAFLCSSSAVYAKSFGGKCLYTDREKFESKFHPCIVTPTKTDLKLIFTDIKYATGNQTIEGNSITQIASGNYARRLLAGPGSTIGGILFAPLGIANSLFKKDYQEYVVDYTLKGEKKATVVRIQPNDAPAFHEELSTLASEIPIQMDEPKKKTIIDL